MSVIDRLSYVIEADTSQFKNGITATKRELRAAAEVAASTRTPLEKLATAEKNLDDLLAKGAITAQQRSRALAQMRAEMTETAKASEAAAKAEQHWRNVSRVGMVAGAAAIGFAARGVSLAAEAETASTAFRVLTGDVGQAQRLMSQMKEFAAQTPFQFPELRDAGKNLLAFGVAANDVVPTLRRLGDIGALTGNSVSELAELYGKAKVQGRLFAEDMNQFQGRGIPIVQELAKQLGVGTDEIRKLVEQGKIGFPELEAAIKSMTGAGGQFAGGTAALADTIAGRWSTLKDKFDEVAQSFGERLLPLLERLIPVAELLANALGKVAGAVSGVEPTTAAEKTAGRLTRGAIRQIPGLGIAADAWMTVIQESNRDAANRKAAEGRFGAMQWLTRHVAGQDGAVAGGFRSLFGRTLMTGDRIANGSSGLKGGDLATMKDGHLNSLPGSVLGTLGGIGASVGGGLLGGVAAAGEGLGIGVRNAGLIAHMRSLLIDNGPVTVGAAAKLKGSQEAFAADQARKVGREQDEAMRIRKEQLKALIEIANKLGVAVPTDITGVL